MSRNPVASQETHDAYTNINNIINLFYLSFSVKYPLIFILQCVRGIRVGTIIATL